MAFIAHADTGERKSVSTKFNYSKGERQPFAIVTETYASGKTATGRFDGKLQRTNLNHTHETYDVSGTFSFQN